MLLKWNLLQFATIFSCSGALICILLHYITNVSPITGVFFPIYIITLFIFSVSFSFKFIQWLLNLDKPIKYDIDDIVKNYPSLSFMSRILPQVNASPAKEYKEYDTNELSIITSVLERKLVSSWYVPYVSQEIGFPFACKQLLDQIVGKAFQICHNIENKDVFVDVCSILADHLREYKKAVKKHELDPESSIDKLYKKSHIISNDPKKTSADHCTNIIRIVLKDLISWELWDTPHSELIIRVLAKKLDSFINTTLTDPQWLNDRLLKILESKDDSGPKTEAKKEKEVVKEEVKMEVPKSETTIEAALSTVITKTTAPILQRAVEEPLDKAEEKQYVSESVRGSESEAVEIKTSPVLRQRRGRQGRNEVKIYDRIIEGSVKTWETDVDLQCISLGQDLLASLDGELTLSRLWDHEPDADASPHRDRSPQPLWFGEEDAIDVELAEAHERTLPRHSPKTELLKDLQTTVHQAKTKIGDLQVQLAVVNTADEAAGMMEGLLDFGIAGIRKGLRFTGLSDESQEKSPSHSKERVDRAPSPDAVIAKPDDSKDVSSSTQKEEINGVPHLVKQQRVASQDSVNKTKGEWSSPMGVPLQESPEPQYEEAADLSTSIAKLRSLLQQRADADRSEVWWEGAEETRGRALPQPAHPAHPSRRVDTATLADEYDMTAERNSPGHTSNNMQRLDKLFQRTVTGVFNSLRTAVGGEEQPAPAHPWLYVATHNDYTVCERVSRMCSAARGRGRVDAGRDSLAPRGDASRAAGERGRCCRGALALAGAAGLATSHHTHTLLTLLIADLGESLLEGWLSGLGPWAREAVFSAFEDEAPAAPLRPHYEQETCDKLCEKLAGLSIFGERTVRDACVLAVRSLGHRELNRQVALQLLDVLVAHFKRAAARSDSSFDDN